MNRFAYVLGVMRSRARVSSGSNPVHIGSNLPINSAIQVTKARKPSVHAPVQGIICPLMRFSTGGGGWGGTPLRDHRNDYAKEIF